MTVGVLYCGDMGAALARKLHGAGLRVVTTCQRRGDRTAEQARAAGIEVLPTLDEVVSQSDLLFSLVLPGAALRAARQVFARSRLMPRGSVFIEANTIGIKALERIERLAGDRGVPFVDATIFGSAHRLEDMGVLYVSGGPAERVCAALGEILRVRPLGDRAGLATRLKLSFAGIAKGMPALFVEIGVLAEKDGLLDPFLRMCRDFYPGVMTAMERMLPTYPRHASRRASELRNVEELARTSGQRAGMIREARKLVATSDWGDPGPDVASHDVTSVVRTVSRTRRETRSSTALKEYPQ